METLNTNEEIIQLLEQYAERMALSVMRGANFTQCLKINGVAPSITIMTPKNQCITLHGRDLSNDRTWKKFLLTQSPSLDLCRLTDVVDLLAKRYRAWLRTNYTQRYQVLSTQTELDWFEQVTLWVVVYKIMERKYEAFTYERREAFADPWVAEEMSVLMRLNVMKSEIARSIHQIVKHTGTLQQMITNLYETHAAYLEKRPRRARVPLPPLPPEATMPLEFLQDSNGDTIDE